MMLNEADMLRECMMVDWLVVLLQVTVTISVVTPCWSSPSPLLPQRSSPIPRYCRKFNFHYRGFPEVLALSPLPRSSLSRTVGGCVPQSGTRNSETSLFISFYSGMRYMPDHHMLQSEDDFSWHNNVHIHTMFHENSSRTFPILPYK